METNQTITAIIVDDEPLAIETLCTDLNQISEINVVATETSSLKAKSLITKLQPDLLFLDMEMPQMSGLELLDSLEPEIHSNMAVVFYSAFDTYILDALRASAFDYLLKPYKIEELQTIINRFDKRVVKKTINFEQSLRKLMNIDRKFALQTLTEMYLLRSSEVLYFHYINDARCWQVVLTTLKCYHLRVVIKAKDILLLSPSFVRISSNCILNIEYLSSIENNSSVCRLYPPYNKIQLIASRRYLSKVKETLDIL